VVSWPARLWVVRHGQSAGNVARDRAELGGGLSIDIAERDADVPLSALGEDQARALGRWFAALPGDERPTCIFGSPYRRASQTATLIAETLGPAGAPPRIDERLREKDLGSLDRLTIAGWSERYPEQAEVRRRLGKFYYRPPGGESWCDVAFRLRSVIDELRRWRAGQRVLIVAHQIVVLSLRYIVEGLTEAEVLDIDARGQVANGSITAFVAPVGAGETMTLSVYNDVTPLRSAEEAVTSAPDVPAGPR
jgi:probable phosphoglycerate mutase